MISQVKGEYLNSFRQAIEKRTLDMDLETTQYDDTLMVSYLTQNLAKANTKQLIYMLDLLENSDNPQMVPQLLDLLQHKSWEVRLKTLKIINNYDPDPFLSRVSDMIYDNQFEVKVRAIQYLLLNTKKSKVMIHALLANTDYKICSAAILAASLASRKDTLFREQINFTELFDNFINQDCIANLNPQQIIFIKIILIRMIGITREEKFYPFLMNLLHEQQLPVLRAAIENAGSTKHEMFIPILIESVKKTLVRRQARGALSNYGNAILPYIRDILMDEQSDPRFKYVLPRVLSRINTQEAAKLSSELLENGELKFRYFTIKALNRLRTENPTLRFNIPLIENIIFEEAENYYRHLAELIMIKSIEKQQEDSSGLILLEKALNERIDNTLEKIFRLLGLIYSPGDIYNAYLALTSRKIDSNANAVEFLDNLLNNKLKKHILPIVEFANDNNNERIPEINTAVMFNSENEAFNSILADNDSWLKSCLLYYMACRKLALNDEQTKLLNNEQDFIVRETLQLYQRQFKQQD